MTNNKKLAIKYKMICGVKRAYADNNLAHLFLALMKGRRVKTFTLEQVDILKEIAKTLNFEIEEKLVR